MRYEFFPKKAYGYDDFIDGDVLQTKTPESFLVLQTEDDIKVWHAKNPNLKPNNFYLRRPEKHNVIVLGGVPIEPVCFHKLIHVS